MSAFKVSLRPRTDVMDAAPAMSSVVNGPAMSSLVVDRSAGAPALSSSDAVMSCAPSVVMNSTGVTMNSIPGPALDSAQLAGRELSPLSGR
jgi:hypothetical protein